MVTPDYTLDRIEWNVVGRENLGHVCWYLNFPTPLLDRFPYGWSMVVEVFSDPQIKQQPSTGWFVMNEEAVTWTGEVLVFSRWTWSGEIGQRYLSHKP